MDAADRLRFRTEWQQNFAVSANAGSGKTTAISARLAAMARSPEASKALPKTAVVTFTKKAAAQIGQRARTVLIRELSTDRTGDLSALDHLERAFFGTIHSFCLLLARRYGQSLGIHLNPTVIAEQDDAWWEEFLEQDAMQFHALAPAQVSAFLRHVPVEHIFGLARTLNLDTAHRLLRGAPAGLPQAPSEVVLAEILALTPKGSGRKNLEISQQAARAWFEQFSDRTVFLPPFEPAGNATALVELVARWMGPLKRWLGDAAAALAAELALRYRTFRIDRGVQTYADQVEAALAVLRDRDTLERIRAEGWRIILDEAQDTDAQQFAVLVEIARPPGAELYSWPVGGGPGPRPGHFCMVGDGQQAIYGARADIRNFLRHLDAFRRGDGGELLTFRVTFRAPGEVVSLLNAGLPQAFGADRSHNLGLAVGEGVVEPLLQVAYEPLAPAPDNVSGAASILELTLPATFPTSVEGWLVEEVRQIADFLARHGPSSVGATQWGEICVLAPRNEWLNVARKVFEQRGLKVALQIRRQRQGDNPAFAWLAGLISVLCDPENGYEWFGVLREIFGVSDALLATEFREQGAYRWDEPEAHPDPLGAALVTVRPWILRVDDGGMPLMRFVEDLCAACGIFEKLRLLDPAGGYEEELARLISDAAEFGREGAGVRPWLRRLLGQLEEGRPVGKPEADAINLLTAHSAKGLEWPVVIPLGLWRRIGKPPESGLRLVPQAGGEIAVYFDGSSVPEDTQEARDRERLRELVRLLYVTLTRVRRHLVIPWHRQFGGRQRSGISFAELWGTIELFEALPHLQPPGEVGPCEEVAKAAPVAQIAEILTLPLTYAPLPQRLLPHQLSRKPDAIRAARHEATTFEWVPPTADDDAIDYGLWWHEMAEFLPWEAGEAMVEDYFNRSIERAGAIGLEERAAADIKRFRASTAWVEIRRSKWTRLTELAVFAPSSESGWVDGVIDLVLQDPKAKEVWVLDWKTNRRRAHESEADFLKRLAEEYLPQLSAYGACVGQFFLDHRIRLWIFGCAVGNWIEIKP